MQKGDAGKFTAIPQTDARQVFEEGRRVEAPSLIIAVHFALGCGKWTVWTCRWSGDGDGFLSGRKFKRHVPNPPIAEEFWEIWVSPQGN